MRLVSSRRRLLALGLVGALFACEAAPAYAAATFLTVREETPAQLTARCGEAWEHDQTGIEGGGCPSEREIVCSRPGDEIVASDDPALVLYSEQPTLQDKKITLADRRMSMCDKSEAPAFAAGQAILYEALTRGEFVCDDHPERCEDALIVSRDEYEAITSRLCGPNGSVSRDENGPVCDRGEENHHGQ